MDKAKAAVEAGFTVCQETRNPTVDVATLERLVKLLDPYKKDTILKYVGMIIAILGIIYFREIIRYIYQ